MRQRALCIVNLFTAIHGVSFTRGDRKYLFKKKFAQYLDTAKFTAPAGAEVQRETNNSFAGDIDDCPKISTR